MHAASCVNLITNLGNRANKLEKKSFYSWASSIKLEFTGHVPAFARPSVRFCQCAIAAIYTP